MDDWKDVRFVVLSKADLADPNVVGAYHRLLDEMTVRLMWEESCSEARRSYFHWAQGSGGGFVVGALASSEVAPTRKAA